VVDHEEGQIMAVNIVMPQAGQDLEVGTVVEWLKREGDPVAKGEPVVQIQTEKITLDIEAPAAGVLRRILVPDGTEAPILSVIGIIGAEDEDLP
jgi:pyruvate/2-oxoglutarate dehydrogenase complex dihydrolipoamide acyltransferase (E2) component